MVFVLSHRWSMSLSASTDWSTSSWNLRHLLNLPLLNWNTFLVSVFVCMCVWWPWKNNYCCMCLPKLKQQLSQGKSLLACLGCWSSLKAGKQSAKYSSPSCNFPSCQFSGNVAISARSTKKLLCNTEVLLFTTRRDLVTKSIPEAVAMARPWILVMARSHGTPAMRSKQRTANECGLTMPQANVFSPSHANRHSRRPTPMPRQSLCTTSCVIHITSPTLAATRFRMIHPREKEKEGAFMK